MSRLEKILDSFKQLKVSVQIALVVAFVFIIVILLSILLLVGYNVVLAAGIVSFLAALKVLFERNSHPPNS